MLRTAKNRHPGKSRDPLLSRPSGNQMDSGLRRHDSFWLCGVVLLAGLLSLIAVVSAQADDSAAARLTRLLAAQEKQEGPASPHLLPVLEQLAQARRRAGDLN